jgi:feruloyl esterase
LQVPPAAAAQADPRAACAALAGLDLAALPDAPTQVLDVASFAAVAPTPAYCRVRGYVRANVQFELRLPTGGWNGKRIMEGCGGFCGTLQYAEGCEDRVRRGYACIVSDMGHVSTPFDAKWAWNSREAEIDFGYRATHVTAVAGKATTAALYARARQHFDARDGIVDGIIGDPFSCDFDPASVAG